MLIYYKIINLSKNREEVRAQHNMTTPIISFEIVKRRHQFNEDSTREDNSVKTSGEKSMEKSVEKSLEKADVEESDYYMYAYFRDRLWQVAEMVLRLKDATLVSVFVGELMELPHIGAEQERLDWLEDIYQDLLSHPEERFKAKRPIAMEDKLLLQEILDYFEVTAQALEDIPIIPVKPASQGGHRVIFKDHRAFVKR